MKSKTKTDDFAEEMGENPMGRRIDLRAVGPFVLERYDRLLFHRRRREEDKPELQRIGIWTRADADHWREYRKVAELKTYADEIGEMWADLTDTDSVAEWVDDHPADD